jgi:hypothetical protein
LARPTHPARIVRRRFSQVVQNPQKRVARAEEG